MKNTNNRHHRAVRGVACLVVLAAVGYLGYTLGSTAPSGRPAVAASGAPVPTETAEITEPAAGPAPAAGTGRDALTPAESSAALALAIDPDIRNRTTDVDGAAGPEIMTVQLPADVPSGGPRRAEVLLYDYRTDRLLKRVVDLTGRRVVQTFTATGMQPPATARETTAAATLLWEDKLAELVRDRYQTRTGAPLTSLEQLSIQSQTFIADPGSRPAASACGTHRCLILLPQPPGGQFIDLTDVVVDLSARTVLRLNE